MTLSSAPLTRQITRVIPADGPDGLIVALPIGEKVTVIHRTGEKVQVRWRHTPLVVDAGAIDSK